LLPFGVSRMAIALRATIVPAFTLAFRPFVA
jgi:hypothetical protein